MMAARTSEQKVRELVQIELASHRRWLHRFTLVGTSTMLAVILSLWATEPKPLPLRLHVSFAIMSVIATGWILVLANILVRKNCPTAWDRIATAWMAVVGSGTFAIASLVTTWFRGDMMAMLTLGMVSGGLLAFAAIHLRIAYRWRNILRQWLSEPND